MDLDLTQEIAQRLGSSPKAVGPLLEEVVQRILQTTAQGKTARLPGTGIFQDHGAGLVFEPDPGLAEIVNAPFSGLDTITLTQPAQVSETGRALRGRRTRRSMPHASRRRMRKHSQEHVLPGIGMIVIVGIIAAGAWFMLADRTADPARPDIAISASEESVPGDFSSPGDTLPLESETSPVLVPPVPNDTLAARPAPLRGDEDIDRTLGGYTIIVFSETNEEDARNAAQSWREQGFRVIILPDMQDDTPRYRVGVGQFDLLEEAARIRDALAGSELPQDAWVLRI
ncbi:MAG: hypothetical protein F4Y00_09140 [Bacteroidetes bacterium SB0662_bin_6]|nr:hypothetical protein [Bacteroidetes bacterium SB0668_bin_1]MYE05118.1 hypothetical protein [Bacteroidetes bacterium SB0662_bin_6]